MRSAARQATVAVLFLATTITLLVTAACEPQRSQEIPVGLLGVWTTEADSYRGRFLEIRTDLVRYGTGEGEPVSDGVVGVSEEKVETGIAYTLFCTDSEGGEYKLNLLYDPSSSVLRLRNRPQVLWRKEIAARVSWLTPRARLRESGDGG